MMTDIVDAPLGSPLLATRRGVSGPSRLLALGVFWLFFSIRTTARRIRTLPPLRGEDQPIAGVDPVALDLLACD